MSELLYSEFERFVNESVDDFHETRLRKLSEHKVGTLVRRKNPFLYKTKSVQSAREYVLNILDASLSSSEEGLFGQLLEELAIFIIEKRFKGIKSPTTGIDLDFTKAGIRYLVSVKSGSSWGNSSSTRKQKTDFRKAYDTVRQSHQTQQVELVIGVCYGNARPTTRDGIQKLAGQAFWNLLTDDHDFYLKLIRTVGLKATQYNADFLLRKEEIVNELTINFEAMFCHDGEIDWDLVMKHNSGNLYTPI